MSPRQSLLLNLLLWLLILIFSAALSLKHNRQADWTASQRNTLSATSKDLLNTLPEAVLAQAFVFPSADMQAEISARFAPYQMAKPNFRLEFIDPSKAPQKVRELGIAESGEVILYYQGRHERLTQLSESEISGALQRLSYAEQALVVFAKGHGERNLEDEARAGYQEFAQALREKGLRVQSLSLAIQSLPTDTRLLILAAPQTALLPGELTRIQAYLAKGGNLLWLFDPDLPAIPELADQLGIQQLAGTVVYQDYELLGTGHPALALVGEYPEHPIAERMDGLSAFPLTGAMLVIDAQNWQHSPLLRSVDRSWLETGPLQGQLSFDEQQDHPGPLNLGLALKKKSAAALDQRAAVIADSDFASNAYLPQLGNRQFALALTQWLLGRDGQLHIDLPQAPDQHLQLSPLSTRLLAVLFVLILPLGFIGTGLWRYKRRGQQR